MIVLSLLCVGGCGGIVVLPALSVLVRWYVARGWYWFADNGLGSEGAAALGPHLAKLINLTSLNLTRESMGVCVCLEVTSYTHILHPH